MTGIRCTFENPRSSDRQSFSIRIEKTKCANILFGFCVKSEESDRALASNNLGYSNTKFSFMLYLYNGCYSCRSSSYDYITTPKNLQNAAKNPQSVFSASIDTKNRILTFYLNGILLGPERFLNLSPQESQMMCPCVDIGMEGDRVSLVFQELELQN